MPVDPVCGIELDESLALVHEYEGKSIISAATDAREFFPKNQTSGRNLNRITSTHATKMRVLLYGIITIRTF